MVTTPEPLSQPALRAAVEECLVAATIATEVPPRPVGAFTAEMIPLAVRAVAEVIANRAQSQQFPRSPLGVVLQPKQFSGVMRGVTAVQLGHRDIWLDAVTGAWMPDHVARCLSEWRRLARMPEQRLVPGALFYYSPIGMIPKGRVPGWVADLTPVPLAGVSEDFFRFYR